MSHSQFFRGIPEVMTDRPEMMFLYLSTAPIMLRGLDVLTRGFVSLLVSASMGVLETEPLQMPRLYGHLQQDTGVS